MSRIAIATAILLALAGCATAPGMQPDFRAMSREEVIEASQQCKSGGLNYHVEYAWKDVNGRPVKFPVDVQCTPRY